MILCLDLSYRPGSLALEEFAYPIAAIVRKAGEDAKIVHYTKLGAGLPPGTDAVILCGTAIRDTGYLGRLELFCWLPEAPVPVLGICAGMQVISTVHGGETEAGCEIGMTEIEVIRPDPLFVEKDRFQAYEIHTLACMPPPGFVTLAVSGTCVQAIRHPKKAVYGVMFHPEVRNEWLVERFLRMGRNL